MSSKNKLRSVESHFKFGENWRSYVDTMSERSIEEAERGLTRLFPKGELQGHRFLDIGCGSGLHMLAAQRLGAAEIVGIDLDSVSVQTAETFLSTHANSRTWSVKIKDAFDLDPRQDGVYDVVYSWGVLHHTGDIWIAIRKAAAMVAPGGHLALALYRHTPLCGFWRAEKKIYSTSPRFVQAIMRVLYKAIYLCGLIATGRSPAKYIRNYVSARGMDWSHDVHDWLGGYPYDSIRPLQLIAFLQDLGFSIERVFEHPTALMGILGSHCDEFVARR
jgi:2-polyprenyl-3-methyl-5-hydroxy-6-metoxy-1,4-benzoquinol methylase